MTLSESQETSLVVRNDEDNEGNPSSFGGEHSTTDTAFGCSQDPSPLSCGQQNRVSLRENNTVAVVIPAARPPKRTRNPAKRPYRRRPKKQKYGEAPFDESDESDNSADDDYVEQTPQVHDRYRPTKKSRQLPVTHSNRSDRGKVIGFQLGGLSLPDLSTVSQGRLTCDIESSHVVYTFSWLEERECSDRLLTKDKLPNHAYNHHDINSAQEWKSYASSNDEIDQISCNKQHNSHLSAREADPGKLLKRKNKWTPEADARLKQLWEKDKLPLSQIQKHFPNRTEGAIKGRYYTVLKNLACVPSPEPVLQNRTPQSLDTATDGTSRSRPARSRRAVERYSP